MKDANDAYAERAACPLYTAIAVIDGRWKPMIYQRLLQRPYRVWRIAPRDATRHYQSAATAAS
jgi:DNA-binding HxlR family transcriptional regulator